MLGDKVTLEQQYGLLKQPTTTLLSTMTKKRINPNATFQPKDVHITLPTEPSKLVKPIYPHIVETVKEEPPQIQPTENTHGDTLHFIDIDKLQPGRSSAKAKAYDLADLKALAKRLKILKNQKSKVNFIDDIKNELDKLFHGEPNLIGDIKKLSDENIHDIKQISHLFEKHLISKATATDLIRKIKSVLKKYSTSNVLHMHVIDVIEHEWLPVKKG